MNLVIKTLGGGSVGFHRYWRMKIGDNGAEIGEIEMTERDNGYAVTAVDPDSVILNNTCTFSGSSTEAQRITWTDGDMTDQIGNVFSPDYMTWDIVVPKAVKYIRVNRHAYTMTYVTVSWSDDGTNWTESDNLTLGTGTLDQFSANNYIEITYP